MEHNAVAIFVDGGGVGGGVVDQLNHMGAPVYEVTFGGSSDNSNLEDPTTKYLNKRAEIWGALRSWLKKGCIPISIPMIEQELPTEMSVPTYTYAREDYIQLEGKKDLRRRKEKSPDATDALACTFAYPSAIPVPGPTDAFGRQSRPDNNRYEDPDPLEEFEKEYM